MLSGSAQRRHGAASILDAPHHCRIGRTATVLRLFGRLQGQCVDFLHAAVAVKQEGVVRQERHPRRTGLREVFQVDYKFDVMVSKVYSNRSLGKLLRIHPFAIMRPVCVRKRVCDMKVKNRQISFFEPRCRGQSASATLLIPESFFRPLAGSIASHPRPCDFIQGVSVPQGKSEQVGEMQLS